MQRYICVHGHFYQPPRENPWLEAIEMQDSAYPFHDWNERITAESYGPNARSRILDGDGRIERIANNYARMSFNFGPTLLSWMAEQAPDIYQAILEADADSAQQFSGHGSAMSQAYNHLIMPLANSRDKYTQALWGLRDFEHRFGRKPEGMWLPETAVDIESLDIMAQLGIKYTILEPGQAKRTRPANARTWTDVSGGKIDPTRGYFVKLPSGRRINVVFYDGPISRAVAFEGLLSSGEKFEERLKSGFSDEREWPQLVNIATDGESYGHHHRFGDMALAYALEHLQNGDQARLTNYAEYLAKHPPEHEVEIRENTSWSCSHGIERWRSDCGCSTGGRPEWNQEWRAPLREALDWLRDHISPFYQAEAAKYLRDPWEARNEYISVILDRSGESIGRYFDANGAPGLRRDDWTPALKLLEMQRHAQLMFTSCGWFFDELSGIETTQVIQYAGRVIQLAQEMFGDHIEEEFTQRLSNARSNLPEYGDGRVVYEKAVRPAIVNLSKVVAHFAVSSLFEDYERQSRVYCYEIALQDCVKQDSGQAQMTVGRAKVTSVITGESEADTFGVLHFGDHNITAGVRPYRGEDQYGEMKAEALEAFDRSDLPEALRVLDRHFGELTYSLRSLFKDEQRAVLRRVLSNTVSEAEAAYRQIFEHHAPLMRFLMDIGFPMPGSFQAAAQLVTKANLTRALQEAPLDRARIVAVLADATAWNVQLDHDGLAYTARLTLDGLAQRFSEHPDDNQALRTLETSTEVLGDLPFTVDISAVQNHYWTIMQSHYKTYRQRSAESDTSAMAWVETFRKLGANLRMRVD